MDRRYSPQISIVTYFLVMASHSPEVRTTLIAALSLVLSSGSSLRTPPPTPGLDTLPSIGTVPFNVRRNIAPQSAHGRCPIAHRRRHSSGRPPSRPIRR